MERQPNQTTVLLALTLALGAPATAAADELFVENFDGTQTILDPVLANSESSITQDEAYAGTGALMMTASEAGLFSARFPLAHSVERAYARYMFRVGNPESGCWDGGQHYKNMGFEGGTNDCKGGDYTSDGTDCFTVRTRFNWPNLGVRVESPPYPGLFDTLVEDVDAADGEWHCLEVDVQLNDPGQANGTIDVRVDGSPAQAAGLEFRTVGSLTIDKWWMTYWANDEWCGPLFIDELVVADEPIGCPGAAPPQDPDDTGDGGVDDGAASDGPAGDDGAGTSSSGGDSGGSATTWTPGTTSGDDGFSGDEAASSGGVAPGSDAAGFEPGAAVGCGCRSEPGGATAVLWCLALLGLRRRMR
ncbi:MAG: hypothetical protein AAF721_01795 [Myxococcota bacterium]